MFGALRQHLGMLFHELAKQKGCEIVEGHLMVDHVRMCISIPLKYAVSNVVGYISGESLFLRKLVLGFPAQASGRNLRDR